METEPARLRAVLNTNVIIAALRSRNPSSPTAELLRRWEQRAFDVLYSADLRTEYEDKFSEHAIDVARTAPFLATLERLGTLVQLTLADIVPVITADPDDDLPLACAVVGHATHLVSYDQHYAFLDGQYGGIRIVDALHFLYLVRGDVPPTVPH